MSPKFGLGLSSARFPALSVPCLFLLCPRHVSFPERAPLSFFFLLRIKKRQTEVRRFSIRIEFLRVFCRSGTCKLKEYDSVVLFHDFQFLGVAEIRVRIVAFLGTETDDIVIKDIRPGTVHRILGSFDLQV